MIRQAVSVCAGARAQKPTPKISVVIEEPAWRDDAAALRLLRRAAKLALESPPYPDPLPLGGRGKRAAKRQAGEGAQPAVTILLSNDAKLKSLNRDFRRKNKPTNVLSFPCEDGAYIGDIAIAHQTVARQAQAQAKPFANHAAHLAIHGILHLLDYDHEDVNQAFIMETLETRLLSRLGIPSPYGPPPLTRRKKAA